ncbi:MAG: hypothetical protein K6T31_07110 [Alicyclobacillus sp.]|nr:hypothetical protein [Alicyclobacillus sp.]
MYQKQGWVYHDYVYQYNRTSTLMAAYGKLQHPCFRSYVIREKSGVYGALKHFFARTDSGVKPA